MFFPPLQGLVLKGWIYVTSDKAHAAKKAIKYLDEGIQDNTEIFGMMGKVDNLLLALLSFSLILDRITKWLELYPWRLKPWGTANPTPKSFNLILGRARCTDTH